MELSFWVAAITLSVQADLADESNLSEMQLFRMAISGFCGSQAITLGSEAFGCLREVGGVIGD